MLVLGPWKRQLSTAVVSTPRDTLFTWAYEWNQLLNYWKDGKPQKLGYNDIELDGYLSYLYTYIYIYGGFLSHGVIPVDHPFE